MNNRALLVLRIGLGITFIWIGALIMQEPEGWAGLIRSEFAQFIPVDASTMMFNTGILDIIIGILLILGVWLWAMGLIAALHMLGVIATIYIGDTTARDIGLMAAGLAIMLSSPMPVFVRKLLRRR